MGTQKHTATPLRLELIENWPFGVAVYSGNECLIRQDSPCYSSKQKTRAQNEAGRFMEDSCGAEIAANAVKEQSDLFMRIVRCVNSHQRLVDLLIESQTGIGGDWRERRDAALKQATEE